MIGVPSGWERLAAWAWSRDINYWGRIWWLMKTCWELCSTCEMDEREDYTEIEP